VGFWRGPRRRRDAPLGERKEDEENDRRRSGDRSIMEDSKSEEKTGRIGLEQKLSDDEVRRAVNSRTRTDSNHPSPTRAKRGGDVRREGRNNRQIVSSMRL
jgi:hypothetical protein